MTVNQHGDIPDYERPRPELEEYDEAWVGCSACDAKQKALSGLDKYLWWRGHLAEHVRGSR